MTIKTRLIANLLFTAAIIVVITITSFFSMRFLQQKLVYLTEKSAPFQMKTAELQRELQSSITALLKVNYARTMVEYKSAQIDAEKSLNNVDRIREAVAKMSSRTLDLSDEIDKIALELFVAVEDRINSSDAALSANLKALQSMKESAARLNDLNMAVRVMQLTYSKAFAEAIEKTGKASEKLRSIEELRNFVRELQLVAITAQNAQSSTTILIARAKLKSLTSRIKNNTYYKSIKSISTITNGFIDQLTQYLKFQLLYVTQKDDDHQKKAASSGQDIAFKLNDLFQMLDQETILAQDELNLAHSRQGSIFTQSEKANAILVTNSELVALSLRVTGNTNRLFTMDSAKDINTLDSILRELFAGINQRTKMLEISLKTAENKKELNYLNAAMVSLANVYSEIYSSKGILYTLKNKLQDVEKANSASDKLRELVIKQTTMGKESISLAQGEQEQAISSVNSSVSSTLYKIIGIGVTAIIIGIIFGFWIYKSVLSPLRLVLDAVCKQQEMAKEKAILAEAVASGELDLEVTISEAITLDKNLTNNDEMSEVLHAVAGMSIAQVSLDRAFAKMTSSLLVSRSEEERRDHLKNGLYQLNKILRGERNTKELVDEALAFIASFVEAGVGIIYLYEEKEEMITTLSTYAISRSKEVSSGFKLGEGLAGQVASERKMICVNRVPTDYLPITSALGEATPLCVTIMPIMHNDILVGVLELGSFRAFDNDDFNFLNESLEEIAIAIKVNRSRQRINELLEQTQSQTEELRVQQEELQQSNEELGERARMLALKHDKR